MKLGRISISTFCAMFVALGMFVWLALWYDENLQPPSGLENAFRGVCLLALWPFWITEVLLGHDPYNPIGLWLVWIATGLFWGVVVELGFIWKSRPRSDEPRPDRMRASPPRVIFR